MAQIEESATVVDWFKERLASPFLFTYTLIAVAYNWKFIGWVLYQPLKFEDKVLRIESGTAPVFFYICMPLLITFLVLIAAPLANNLGEFSVKFANRSLSALLNKFKWDEYIKVSQFNEIQVEKQALARQNIELDSNNTDLTKKYHKLSDDNLTLREQLESLTDSFNKQTDSYNELSRSYEKAQIQHLTDLSENMNLSLELKKANYSLKTYRLQTAFKLAKKNIQLHQSSGSALSVSLANEVKDQLQKQSLKANWFTDNFDQEIDHPIYGVLIEGSFYKSGRIILLPSLLKNRNLISIDIILNGFADGLELFLIDSNDNEIKLETMQVTLKPNKDSMHFADIKLVKGKAESQVELFFDEYIEQYKNPLK